MKKFLFSLCFVFLYTNLSAQTGKELIETCISAMQLNKLDSFKTMSVKAYQYDTRGNKGALRYYSKDYGEGDDVETKARLELSSMGKDQVFVFADDEIFQVVPKYEEIDREDAGQLVMIISTLFPTHGLFLVSKDTSDKVIYNLQDGTTKFNDKNCKKISVSSAEKPDDIIQHLYFDEATNWFQGIENPTENGTISMLCSGFKKTKGHVYPTTIKILSNGKKAAEIEIDKLEVDINIEDSMFSTTKK
ncbi:MAG: hypothetical protein FWG85_04775 [Bacteroidetes bacterium]|nr:hypothetical protein [Bacteroidota bacterium]